MGVKADGILRFTLDQFGVVGATTYTRVVKPMKTDRSLPSTIVAQNIPGFHININIYIVRL